VEIEKNKYDELNDSVKSLESRRQELTFEIKKSESVRNNLNDDIISKRNELEKLKLELDNLRNLISDHEKRKFEAEESTLKLENLMTTTIVKFNDELQNSSQKLNGIKHEILNRERELGEKEKSLIEKSSQIAEYGSLIKVMKREKDNLEENIQNLRANERELNNIYESLNDRLTKRKNHQRNWMLICRGLVHAL